MKVGSGSNNIGTLLGISANVSLEDGNDRLISSTEIAGSGDNNAGMALVSEQGDAFLDTGTGDDLVRASVSVASGTNNYAIDNQQTINLGAGDDRIETIAPDAFSGYTGAGTVNLGVGDDFIGGFGEQSVDGGDGIDVAQFGFESDFTTVNLGSEPNSLELVANDTTMTLVNVERFNFVDRSYSFDELIAMAEGI